MAQHVQSPLTLGDLFRVFLKVGLTFGGGLALLAVLEEELVRKRQVLDHDEFLTTYSLGRIVPSGTTTALAVAFGYRFGGFLGTVVALSALTLPAVSVTVVLTAAYHSLQGSALFELLPVTILPAALAFIVAAALRMGRNAIAAPPEWMIALAVFVAAAFLDFNPSVLLLLGGIVGIVVCRRAERVGP